MSTTIEMNAYSTGADEGEVNLGEKWARRESVALHKDGESVLPGDKASAPLATKSNVHPWYKRPPFIAAVTVCALVAIIVPSVLLTGDDAEPNLGPTTYGVYEDCNDLRKAVEEDFSGRGSYSYWGTSWQSVAQYGCCDSLAADRRSCQSGALMYRGQPEVMAADAGVAIRGSGASSDSGSGSPSSPASEFSSTNNQVKDVDEPDIVKNDGTYIYTISNRAKLAKSNTTLDSCGASLVIAEAFPVSNAKVVSRLPLQNLKVHQMYLHGDVIVLLGLSEAQRDDDDPFAPWVPANFTMEVWNVTDRAAPRRLRRLEVTGSYVDARLVDGVAYVVLYDWSREVPLMADSSSEVSGFLPATGCDSIGYVSTVRRAGFTTILTLPLDADKVETTALGKTVVAFTVGNVYANTEYIVLAASDYNDMRSIAMLYRLGPNGVTYAGLVADIPGQILNQFSMDIYKGHFRVATTVHSWSQRRDGGWRDDGDNNLYIYDLESFELAGSVERMAKREEIKSARFIAERVYIVTFRKTDPLFVIDAADATNPKVLGYLKIPGFSEYLHPVGGSRLVGVGRDADESTGREKGIKLSLFDNTDPYNPKETYNIIVGNERSRSEVDESHHAFRYIAKHNVIVLPILLHEGEWNDAPTNQGAFVYKIGPSTFELVRILSHFDATSLGDAAWMGRDMGDPLWQYGAFPGNVVRRSLTMDDYLYSVSNNKISIVDMTTGFSDVGAIDLR